MKTILVTGANGQLGNSIRRLAAGYPQYAFVFTDVDTLDICDAQAVNAFVKEKQVDYIINCAASPKFRTASRLIRRQRASSSSALSTAV